MPPRRLADASQCNTLASSPPQPLLINTTTSTLRLVSAVTKVQDQLKIDPACSLTHQTKSRISCLTGRGILKLGPLQPSCFFYFHAHIQCYRGPQLLISSFHLSLSAAGGISSLLYSEILIFEFALTEHDFCYLPHFLMRGVP
jgi:hypothetical protein